MGTIATEPKTNGAYQEAPQQQPDARFNLGPVIDETVRRKAEELQVREADFAFQQRRAALFAKSGLFGKEKDEDQATSIARAMVRIELGEGMGFSPAESLQGIHVISGSAAISSQLRAARMQNAGYSWDIEWFDGKEWDSLRGAECHGCRLWLKFQGKPMLDREGKPVCESYQRSDAEKMLTTIWENGQKRRVSILEKDNWKMSPPNMYFARVAANAQRFHAPHVLSANLPSVEEARDEIEWEYPERFGSKRLSTEVADLKLGLIEKIKAVTDQIQHHPNFAMAMAAAFGDKKWKRYFSACDVAELEEGLRKIGEYVEAIHEEGPTPELAPKSAKATKEQNGAAIAQLIEENFPEGGNDFAKAMSYAFGNSWQKWREASAADIEEGLRLLKEHLGK
jgi:hypothetical protein